MIKKILFVCLLLAAVVFLTVSALPVPDLSPEKITDIPQTLIVYDKNNEVFASMNTGQNRTIVHDIPLCVVQALLCTEDVRFYQHNGIDIKRIFGALLADIKAGGYAQGASTITQQLIKNSHLTSDKTILRKVREAILALQLEKQYSKDEILDMYLNFVYFGRGAYGIQAAAQAYFGVDAAELTTAQAAMLIGVLKAPGRYAPHIDPQKAKQRRDTVLDQMAKYGCISSAEAETIKQEAIVIVENPPRTDYGYYTDYVLEEAAACLNISVEDLMGGGYRVYTELDAPLQEHLQTLSENDALFPEDADGERVETAIVVLDNTSGGIRAMIGGRTHEGQRLYNRACAKRQPGSCIKPVLVYAPAVEENLITPATLLEDARMTFDGYSPTNFHDVYYGKVSARRALALSLNVPAVALLQQVGVEKAKATAVRAGIEFDGDDNHLALALGGMKYGVSPLTLAGAYRMFACGGRTVNTHSVREIRDAQGNTVYRADFAEQDVIRDSTAYLITDMLLDASSSNATGKLANPVACKTGTVGYGEDGYSDAWCTAYTQRNTVCVWTGFDTTTPSHHLPASATGGTYAANLAAQTFRFLFDREIYEPFIPPASVVRCEIDRYTLEKENTLCLATDLTPVSWRAQEWFSRDNAPRTTSCVWQEPALPLSFSVQLNEVRAAQIVLEPSQSFAVYRLYRVRGEEETCLGLLSGQVGERVLFTDEEYREGDAYFVVSEHTRIFDSGEPLTGEKTALAVPE